MNFKKLAAAILAGAALHCGAVAASVDFTTTNISVSETGTSVTLTVTRTPNSNEYRAASVDFRTVPGTASEGVDYVATTGSLTWNAGTPPTGAAAGEPAESGPKTIVIQIKDDSLVEANETFQVVLSNLVGDTFLSPAATSSSATVTIIDNEGVGASTVGLVSDQFSANEGAGQVTVTLQRTGSLVDPASVILVTRPGSATAEQDYASTRQEVRWSAGEGGARQVPILITDDAISEPDEDFVVELQDAQGAVLDAGRARATVTIVDNDGQGAPQVTFARASYFFSESALDVTIPVSRTGSAVGAVSVTVDVDPASATGDDAAIERRDFIFPGDQLLSWADGDLAQKNLQIRILRRSGVQPSRTFKLVFVGPSGAVAGAIPSATVLIFDVDSSNPGRAAVLQSDLQYNVPRGSDSAVIGLTRTGGSDGTLSIITSFRDISAKRNVDYVGTTSEVRWNDGDTSLKLVTIPLINNGANTSASFAMDIIASGGAAQLVPGQSSSTINLIPSSNAAPTGSSAVGFEVNAVSARAADGSVTLQVIRTGNTSGQASVGVRVAGGSLVSGVDYELVTTVLSWDSGDSSPKPVTLSLGSPGFRPDGELTVVLTTPTGTVIGNNSTAKIRVSFSDSPSGASFGWLALLVLGAGAWMRRRPL